MAISMETVFVYQTCPNGIVATALSQSTQILLDTEDTQHLFPLAFLMSMVWLGVLSSLVVNACAPR